LPGISFQTSGVDALPSLDAEIWFDYDGFRVDNAYEQRTGGLDRIVDRPNGRLIFRDREKENAAYIELEDLGLMLVERESEKAAISYRVTLRSFPAIASQLIERGWVVEAEGQRLRQVAEQQLTLSVSSNVDWFELEGDVEFAGAAASLPALLSAIRRGEYFVRLDDGTHGLLPEGMSLAGAALFGIALGGAGQLGDLSESVLKRSLQVKDSGKSVGEVGGMLDLVDSLVLSLPVGYLLFRATFP